MNDTPQLVGWTLALTNSGKQLAEWMQAHHIEFDAPPAPKGSLISPYARFFRANGERAAELWREFSEQADKLSA